MTWAFPWLWWSIPLLIALGSLSWWWRRRTMLALVSTGAGIDEHTPTVGRRRETMRWWLGWGGLLLALIALIGPRWGSSTETRSANGADVLLVIDCSRSMLATDLYPNRMEVARRKAQDLLKRSPGTRLALMPFAAVAALRCPLTGDHQAIAAMLDDCSPDLFPADAGYQGTSIGVAVREGLAVLNRQVERGQAILVMSDGSDEDLGSVSKAAEAAKAAGVPVYGLFLGDTERTVTLDIDGRSEVMSADRTTLDQLATTTGAISVNATTDDADVQALIQHIDGVVAKREWEERRRVVASERYQWFLAPAILLLAVASLLPTRRRG